MNKQSRRRVLGSLVGLLSLSSLAGCLGDAAGDGSRSGGGSPAVRASFFVVYDFARRVAGDAADVENLVPVGQHGHGWSPSPDILRAIFESDAFVYVGEGFQPWADDVVTNIRTDAPDIRIIEARRGVELLGGAEHGGHDEHDTHSGSGTRTEHPERDQHDHGAGGSDPHFWLDPVRAKTAVENVRDGLVDVSADDAATFRENADAYLAGLDDLHATFRSKLEGRSKGAVLVAGHDAFSYLGHRYDFEVHALSGISPDDEPSPRDVVRAQELIEEHGIEHVLAPAFESDRAAKQLVEETDATGVLPVTSIPTTKPGWNEKGWGYVEIMREVNLPSLAIALGVE
jgi:zinc transport system substrate-binding protein